MVTARKKRTRVSFVEHDNYRPKIGTRKNAKPGTVTLVLEVKDDCLMVTMSRKWVTGGDRVQYESSAIKIAGEDREKLKGFVGHD